jgi:DNA-binding protein Fis
MKRVIVQIFPADEASSDPESIQPTNGNGTASGRNGQEADPGVRLEAVLSSERALIVVEMVLDAGGSNGDEPADRMIERLVQRELASDDSGQVFHRVISSVERALLQHAFDECDHIQTRTADRLGVNRNTIHKKLLKHELIQADDEVPDVKPRLAREEDVA